MYAHFDPAQELLPPAACGGDGRSEASQAGFAAGAVAVVDVEVVMAAVVQRDLQVIQGVDLGSSTTSAAVSYKCSRVEVRTPDHPGY